MAFCGNCGAQMEATERFCVKCGKDNGVKTAANPVAAAPQPPAPPVAPTSGPYAGPPTAIPVAMGLPPQAQPKKSSTMGTVIVLAILAAGGYYYYTHRSPDQTPSGSQAPPAGGGAPPAGQAPPAAGGGGGGGGGANAALVKQQAFDAHWQTVNGMIQLTNGTWKNNASVAVQSATLECDQFDTGGNVLDEMRTTLNGPVPPGGTDGFSPFEVGAVAANVNKVTCTIVHVKQAGQQ